MVGTINLMDSKLLLGLGVAAATVGMLYLLLQPVGGKKTSKSKPPASSKGTPAATHAKKPADPANPQRKTASGGPSQKTAASAGQPQRKVHHGGPREAPTDSKVPAGLEKETRAQKIAAFEGQKDQNLRELITYEDGVISTDSLVSVLQTMKQRQDMLMRRMMIDYRKLRRKATDEDEYEEHFESFLQMQSEGMNAVFETTLKEFKITKEHIMKYNEKHGTALFFSHMERMMAESDPIPVELTVEKLIPILQLKAKVIAEKLSGKTSVTQKNIQMASFQAEDAVAAQFKVEDDVVASAIHQFKDNPEVMSAAAAIAAFKPR